jgi:ABC-type antimicrobial peptide transport system permease subunit
VIINQTAARKFFPGDNPIGRRIGSSVETAGELEIVGVLQDAKYDSIREAAPPTMYVPYPQVKTINQAVFAVRTAGNPAAAIGAIREAVRQVHPTLPLTSVNTQMDRVEQRLTQEKVFAQAYALFGGLALVLASIGLFGVMSYSVAGRTSEMGIRMAIGADRRDVLSLVMRESMLLVGVGVAIGVGTAALAGELIKSQLFGVPAFDGPTVLAAVLTLVGASAMAAYIPSRRASRVDPITALRFE